MKRDLQSHKELCYYFHHAIDLPVYLFENQKKIISYPELEEGLDPVILHLRELLSSKRTTSYMITEQFIYYGAIRIKDTDFYIVTGPVSSTLSSTDTIKSIMNNSMIAHNRLKEFTEFFQSIPVLSFAHFLNVLCFVHFICNEENITPDQIFDVDNHTYEIPISEIHAANYFRAKEEQQLHNTYKFEQEYLSYVENGDIAGLEAILQKPFALRAGMVADNNIRQSKNLFVVAATLATRSAVKGGLDIEIAYQLSDTYIREMEKLKDYNLISQLQYDMVYDFTKRVMGTKIPKGISPLVYECMHYVSTHTNEPISVTDIAEHFGKNRNFLYRKFKEELGFDLSSFIMRRKLEEAKSLLSFTDKPVSEISNYLCFSSQSYFQNVFKKKYGLTPKEFREGSSKNKRTI